MHCEARQIQPKFLAQTPLFPPPHPWQPAFSLLFHLYFKTVKVGSPSKAESNSPTLPSRSPRAQKFETSKIGTNWTDERREALLGAGSLRNHPSNESTGLHQSPFRQVYILISLEDLLYEATKMLTSEFCLTSDSVVTVIYPSQFKPELIKAYLNS